MKFSEGKGKRDIYCFIKAVSIPTKALEQKALETEALEQKALETEALEQSAQEMQKRILELQRKLDGLESAKEIFHHEKELAFLRSEAEFIDKAAREKKLELLEVYISFGRRIQKSSSPTAKQRLFGFVELFAFVLPAKVRLSTFEPAYQDEKSEYLKARRRHKSKIARLWLAAWFAAHVGFMVAQCILGMFSEKVKGVFISHLPEFLRKLGGG